MSHKEAMARIAAVYSLLLRLGEEAQAEEQDATGENGDGQ